MEGACGLARPLLATAVLYVIYVYGEELAKDSRMRRVLMVLFTLAFLAAAVAVVWGIDD